MATRFRPDIVFETADGDLLALLPDAVTRIDHKLAAVATENEVERGAAVTDHVRPQQDRLSLEVVFSDTPLDAIEGRDGEFWFGVTGENRPLDLDLPERLVATELAKASRFGRAEGVKTAREEAPARSVDAWQPDGEITRAADNWALLQAARDGAWLAIVTTSVRTYESMVLVGCETSQSAKDGSWIVVGLEFVQITQVATELVDVPVTAPRNRRTQNQGDQPGEEPTPETSRSILEQARRALFGGGS